LPTLIQLLKEKSHCLYKCRYLPKAW